MACIHPYLFNQCNTPASTTSSSMNSFVFLTSRVGGKSTVKDYKLAVGACLPVINAILADTKNKTYPLKCFLNIDLPTDVLNLKVKFA